MLQRHEIVMPLLDQLMVEERVQVLSDVFRPGHLLVHVIQILLAWRGEVDDVTFMAKLFDGLLGGERLKERAVVMSRVVSDECGLHRVTSCNIRIQFCIIVLMS